MQNQTAPRPYGVPESFYSKFGQYVTAVLSGFDRIRFRATLRPLFCPEGPEVYLNHCKVLIKHFKGFAQGLSDRVKKLAYERFQQLGRPQIHLPSSEISKQALGQELVAKEATQERATALSTCWEPALPSPALGHHQSKRFP